MSTKPKDVATFKTQIERLTLANKRLVAQRDALDEELNFAKASLLKIKAGYDARVRTTLKMNIQDVLGITDKETLKLTQGATIDDLEKMYENFSLAVDSQASPYTKPKTKTVSIRGAGAAVPGGENFTVGNLFGKTPEEIRKMGGDF